MDGAERWQILRLHVEDEIPLAELARETKVSLRTLQRWHRSFQDGGIAALDLRTRIDAGRRRTAAETVAFIERLALTKPRPSLATLHRLAVADARHRRTPVPWSGTSSTPWILGSSHSPSRGRRLIGTGMNSSTADALNGRTRYGRRTTRSSTS